MNDNSNKKRSSPTPDDLAEIRRKKHKEYMKKRQEQVKKEMEEQQKKIAAMMNDSSSDEESEDESETQNVCQICKDKIYKDEQTLSCHENRGPHTFHHKCIHPILQQNNNNNNKCPLCRGACLPPEEYIQKYPFIRPPDPAGVAQLIDNLIDQTYLLLNDRILEIELDQFPISQPHAHANGWKWDIFVCDSWYSENNEGYLPYGWKEVKEDGRYRYQDPNGSFTDEDGNEYTNPRESGCGMYEPIEGVAFNRNRDNEGFTPLPAPFKHRNPDADNPCPYCNNQDPNHSEDDHDPRWRKQEDAIDEGKYFQWFLTNKWRAHNRNSLNRHPNYDQANQDTWIPLVLNDDVNLVCPKCADAEDERINSCEKEITIQQRDNDGNVIDEDYMRSCPVHLHKDHDGEHKTFCHYHQLTPHRLIFREGLNNTPKIKTTDMYFDERGFLQIGEEIEKTFVDYDVWNKQRDIWNERMAEKLNDDLDHDHEDYMKKMLYAQCDGGDKNGNCPIPNPKYKQWEDDWRKTQREFRDNNDIDNPENRTKLQKIYREQFEAVKPDKFVFANTGKNEQFFLADDEGEEMHESYTFHNNDWVQVDTGRMYDEYYCPMCVKANIIVTCDNDEECPNYDNENPNTNWLKVNRGEAEKVGDNWYCMDCADKAKKQGGGRKRRKQKKKTRKKKKKSKRRKTRGKRKKLKRRKTKHKHIKNRKTRRRKR